MIALRGKVAPGPVDDLVKSNIGAAMVETVRHLARGFLAGGEVARRSGYQVEEYAGASAAILIQQVAWSVLSGTKDASQFDPAEFGRECERIAREVVPKYVQFCEAKGPRQ